MARVPECRGLRAREHGGQAAATKLLRSAWLRPLAGASSDKLVVPAAAQWAAKDVYDGGDCVSTVNLGAAPNPYTPAVHSRRMSANWRECCLAAAHQRRAQRGGHRPRAASRTRGPPPSGVCRAAEQLAPAVLRPWSGMQLSGTISGAWSGGPPGVHARWRGGPEGSREKVTRADARRALPGGRWRRRRAGERVGSHEGGRGDGGCRGGSGSPWSAPCPCAHSSALTSLDGRRLGAAVGRARCS